MKNAHVLKMWFVLAMTGVSMQTPFTHSEVKHPLLPLAHLGVGCASREEVDRLAEAARAEGRPCYGPVDHGEPVGYFALISDPDHHTLELSHGQEVGLAVEGAAR
jgi:hypothetical protein